MDKNKFKISQFLKVNLSTLKGAELQEFMDKYEVLEVNSVQMMLLDHSGSDNFVSVPNPDKPGHYCIITRDMMEKILLLSPLDPETTDILEEI